jgi:uncharacterized protein (DUF1810 family)
MKKGMKTSDWFGYIFPQIADLGKSGEVIKNIYFGER